VPPIIPGSSAIYNVLGDQHARHGEWAGAISNYAASVKVDPTNHYGYHSLAPLLLQAGDEPGYQRLRDEMLIHFSSVSDPMVAERMTKDCLILPPPAVDLPSIEKMTDVALWAVSPTNKLSPYCEFVKGLFDYRNKNFADAVPRLTRVAAQEGDAARTVEALSALAMAQQQLGHQDEARSVLGKAQSISDARLRQAINWNDQIIAKFLMREAKALIGDSNQLQK